MKWIIQGNMNGARRSVSEEVMNEEVAKKGLEQNGFPDWRHLADLRHRPTIWDRPLFKYCKERHIYFCFGIDLKTFRITFLEISFKSWALKANVPNRNNQCIYRLLFIQSQIWSSSDHLAAGQFMWDWLKTNSAPVHMQKKKCVCVCVAHDVFHCCLTTM